MIDYLPFPEEFPVPTKQRSGRLQEGSFPRIAVAASLTAATISGGSMGVASPRWERIHGTMTCSGTSGMMKSHFPLPSRLRRCFVCILFERANFRASSVRRIFTLEYFRQLTMLSRVTDRMIAISGVKVSGSISALRMRLMTKVRGSLRRWHQVLIRHSRA